MSEIPPLLNEAWDRAAGHIRWSRTYRHGWRLPIEVYQALDVEIPPHPTWESATGALAHAWLELEFPNGTVPPTERQPAQPRDRTPIHAYPVPRTPRSPN